MTRRIPFNFILFCLLLASCQQTNEDLLDKAFKLSKDKKYDEAIKVYGEIIKSNNKIQLAYYNRGHCYLYLKNYPKALADFNKVMSLQIVDDVIITYNDKLPYS